MNIYSTEVLKSNLYHFNDDYILVRGDIVTTAHDNSTPVAFKNCVSFIKCTTKIDGTTIDDAEDWDLVMSMKNLIEYSSNFSETTESLWFYSKDEETKFNATIANNSFKSFKCKTKLLGNTEADGANEILKNATIGLLLKCVSISGDLFKCYLLIPR